MSLFTPFGQVQDFGQNSAMAMPAASNPVGMFSGIGMPAAGIPNMGPTQGYDGGGFTPGAANPATGFGANLSTAQVGLAGIQSLGNLWSAFQAQSMAKKQFAAQQEMAQKNLVNQTTSYNTALEDRATSRAKVEGTSMSALGEYLDKNKLRA